MAKVNPRSRAPNTPRINHHAVAAWKAGDYAALHKALGLGPWHPSPLPAAFMGLGVDPENRPDWMARGRAVGDSLAAWEAACELQAQLLQVAGPIEPDVVRAAYKANLDDAEQRLAYSRKYDAADVPAAEEAVVWRRKLLEELP